MCSELRINRVPVLQQLVSTGMIRHVGRRFTGKHRKRIHTGCLGEFNFGIPVRPFHQTNHHFAANIHSQLAQPLNNMDGAFLISLHGQTKSFPAVKIRVAEYLLDDIQRSFKPVCFFGIHCQANIVFLGHHTQRFKSLWQLFHYPLIVRKLIARMDCRQFYRDTRRLTRPFTGSSFTNYLDGFYIGIVITVCVGEGASPFTKHIVRIDIPFLFFFLSAFYRIFDAFAHDKLAAHHAHGNIHGPADHRLTQAAKSLFQQAKLLTLTFVGIIDHVTGKQ